MTQKRARELRAIAAYLYSEMLDIMGSQDIKAGVEETIVLAEIARKITADVAVWTVLDQKREEIKNRADCTKK